MVGALIQMAGHAGSGKSTLAQSIAAAVGGVVLDLDTVKSALLERGVSWAQASSGSYEVIYGLVRDMVRTEQGVVIVDSPSYWSEIHERLTHEADAAGALYRFLECDADERVRAARLMERTTRRSQGRGLGVNPQDAPPDAVDMHTRPIMRPHHRFCLRVQTDREVDLDQLIAELRLTAEA